MMSTEWIRELAAGGEASGEVLGEESFWPKVIVFALWRTPWRNRFPRQCYIATCERHG